MLARLWIVLLSLGSFACLRTPPPHIRALEANELCTQYLHLGDIERAEVQCDLGLQFAPHYGDLWTNKGIIALFRGHFEEAKKLFIKALRYNPNQAQAYHNLGLIYLKERKFGRAHDNFQRALKVNPDYRESRYNLALTFISMGRKEKARKELLTLTEVYPNLADPFALLGKLAFEEGNVLAAIEYLKHTVLLAPQYADAWLALGNAHYHAGHMDEAVDAYTSCIEASSELPDCPNNLARALNQRALSSKLITELEEAARRDKTPESQFRLARAYKDNGLRSAEKRAYEHCLRLNNRFAACYFGLFELFHDEREEKKAQIACQNFLKFSTDAEFPRERENCQRYLGEEISY